MRSIAWGGSRVVMGAVLLLLARAWADAGVQPTPGRERDLTLRVVHAVTGVPIAGAVVTIEETRVEERAGADGRIAVAGLALGSYHLTVTAPGFLPVRVSVTVTADGVSGPGEVALTPELHYTEVVSVSPQARDQFASYQATSVLAGQALAIELGGTLAGTVLTQPGVAQRSLGPGAARPVIRGFDGDRVVVLEDGQRMGDLSSQSGDHGVNVNPAAAARIEVVRGPSTLLYGSNAIGGLVNVITDLVPTRPVTRPTGSVVSDFGSGAREGGMAADLLVGNGRWALRAGGAGRSASDVRTPEFTVDNTQSRSGLGNVGVAFTTASGFLGGSYQYDDFRYGVPILEEGDVELTPRRHGLSLKGERRDLTGVLARIEGSLNFRHYRHEEVEGEEIGTRFRNRTTEFDLLAHHRPAGRLTGTLGVWGMTRAFEATGEETLSPPVDQRGVAVFAYEEVTWPHVTLQFGGRYEYAAFSPGGGLRPRRFDNLSGSIGLLVRPTENTAIAASVARAVRNPALEELYYFGPHPGNFSFEIGNPDLEAEKGLGVDVAFRWRLPRFTGQVAYFRNEISDYVFRKPITEDEFDERFGHEAHAGGGHHGHGHEEELQFIEFVGQDSRLQGVELHADLHLTEGLLAEVTLDVVRGELKASGEPLPRIPPARLVGALRYERNAWQVGGQVIRAARQDRVFGAETPTDGYTLLNLFGAYVVPAGGAVHTIGLRLNNLTNEVYRNHLSFVKDEVPEMGRDLRLVYSIRF